MISDLFTSIISVLSNIVSFLDGWEIMEGVSFLDLLIVLAIVFMLTGVFLATARGKNGK